MKQYSKKNRTSYLSGLAAILVSTVFSVVLQFFKGDVLDAALAGETTAAVRWAALLLVFILGERPFLLFVRMPGSPICDRMYPDAQTGHFQKYPAAQLCFVQTAPAGVVCLKIYQRGGQHPGILLSNVAAVGANSSEGHLCRRCPFSAGYQDAVLTLVLLTTPLYLPKLIEKQLQNAQQEKIRAVEAVLTAYRIGSADLRFSRTFRLSRMSSKNSARQTTAP